MTSRSQTVRPHPFGRQDHIDRRRLSFSPESRRLSFSRRRASAGRGSSGFACRRSSGCWPVRLSFREASGEAGDFIAAVDHHFGAVKRRPPIRRSCGFAVLADIRFAPSGSVSNSRTFSRLAASPCCSFSHMMSATIRPCADSDQCGSLPSILISASPSAAASS